MARIGLVLVVAVGVLSAAHGFEFSLDKISHVIQKAAGFVKVSDIPTDAVLNEDFHCLRDGLYYNPDECGSYIKCSDNLAYTITCPEGFHFSNETQQCESPCDAFCDQNIACECNWDSCGRSPRFSKDRVIASLKKDSRCIRDGVFSNPDECGTYIQCSNGNAYLMPCPEGLHFNEEEQKCDTPCNAHCEASLACECEWEDACNSPTICFLPAEKGSCTRHLHRWYFDQSSGQCQRFVFGGCKGNENNFQTREACESRCQDAAGMDICTFPAEIGPCRSHLPRWYFDSTSGRCEQFMYGGCNGNQNNFLTREACEGKCEFQDMMSHPYTEEIAPLYDFTCTKDGVYPHPQDCTKHIHCTDGEAFFMPCPSGLHFSSETMRCEKPCDAHCDLNLAEECGWEVEGAVDVCSLPLDDGNCFYYFRRWYFDKSDGQCKRFIYNGCDGNANRFKTQIECELQCLPNAGSVRYFSTEDTTPIFDFTCDEDGLYPDSEDCTNYIKCSNGSAYGMRCPSGLHFCPETVKCEKPCNAQCDPSLAEECGWEEKSDVDVCNLPVSKGPCHGHFRRWYFDSSDGSCKRFVYGGCRSNGNSFKSLKECDSRCIRQKGGLSKISIKHAEPMYATYSCEGEGLYPDQDDCSKYVQCLDGQAYRMPCPTGLHFCPITRRCESPCNAHCDMSLAEECGWSEGYRGKFSSFHPEHPVRSFDYCPEDEISAYPGDCTLYTECINGKRHQMSCPYGRHFNSKTLSCEEPCEARCDESLAEECRWEEKSEIDICRLPAARGPCRSAIPRYYWNAISQRCVRFIYGGCQGNANNFATSDDCERNCGRRQDGMYSKDARKDEPFYPFYPPFLPDPYGRAKANQDSRMHETTTPFVFPPYIPPKAPQDSRMHETTTPFVFPPYIPPKAPQDSRLQETTTPFVFPPYIPPKAPQDSRMHETTTPFVFPPYIPPMATEDYRMDKSSPSFVRQYPPVRPFPYVPPMKSRDSNNLFESLCSTDGLYQHPETCESYIQCSSGTVDVMSCPNGMHFNFENQRCFDPCDAHCDQSYACQCGWPECGNMEVDCEAEPLKGPCKGRMERYYYDRENGECKPFYYGGCGGNTNNFVSKEECKQQCQDKLLEGYRCPASDGKFADAFDCITYYDCERGTPTLKRCPNGRAFDHIKSECVPELEATCLYECHDVDAVYPYRPDCHKYIDCANGISKVEKCPPGEAFDKKERNCIEARAARCYNR